MERESEGPLMARGRWRVARRAASRKKAPEMLAYRPSHRVTQRRHRVVGERRNDRRSREVA